MKFEYVGIFMPKMKRSGAYEKENNMYGTCNNDVTINGNSIGDALVAR